MFLYLFSSKIGIFHKFLYRTFWYSRNYTYFYFPKWRYKPIMVLKITNLHILRYLPTCWLYLLECYTIDNQRCTHTASGNKILYCEIVTISKGFKFSRSRYCETWKIRQVNGCRFVWNTQISDLRKVAIPIWDTLVNRYLAFGHSQ